MDVIKKIEEAKNNLISVEDTLNLLMKTYDCSIEYAAEILLAILPEEKKDYRGNPINPSFFGEKLGKSRFSYISHQPNIYKMLEDIIAHNDSAFDTNIPF